MRRFRTRLTLGLVAMVVVMELTAIVAIVALQFTSRSTNRTSRQFTEDMLLAQRVRLEAEQLVAASRALLITGDEQYRTRFAELATRVDKSLSLLAPVARSRTIARIETDADAYVSAARVVAEHRIAGADPRKILDMFETDLKPKRDIFEKDLDRFLAVERAELEAAISETEDITHQAQLIVIATSTLAIAISLVLAAVGLRRLGNEYARAVEATRIASAAAAGRKELLEIVSHDLRTPLNTISLATVLLRDGALDRDARTNVERIMRATHRMESLIEDLVDTARIESGRLELHCERCDPRSLVSNCVDMFSDRAKASNIGLRAETCTLVPIHADRERVTQVLANLVGNAIKFTPSGGLVTVTTTTVCDGVRIAVTDTGPGIDTVDRDHLFERHWQGPHHAGGLGLGLYICKQLVDAHHGRIGVESAKGSGSTFWIELPIATVT